MGRSVSYPKYADVVVYQELNYSVDDYTEAIPIWLEFVEDLVETLKAMFPSFKEVDKWLDRENLAIAENSFCYFGVSVRYGSVSIWIAPKWKYSSNCDKRLKNLGRAWLDRIQKKFKKAFAQK